ncbi:Asp23/Gls24 family envelope stress response protein [bacterium]|nr:Asp23/Gls24 family envelope stress response protein [bacterium]MBU0899823.1 Asp23/Gls24 family envelope stress response protein [bacterium]MBU1152371.1 Asp23/Gls24 family envelope stress response protein [bacterium]MBU1782324.1 Asp23/Gls24 family envelope stress response protein [bacterium]MBU2599836.1 Asp23/Gls24 family envelope stress response protein [bacterium]
MEERIEPGIGMVKVSDEVVGIIAGLATMEVEGISGMSGGIADGFAKLLTGSQLTKGVKIEVGEKEVAIDAYVIVTYGVNIPEVAWKVQENVKQAVEKMTGLMVAEVNVFIQGVCVKNQEDEGVNKEVS